MMTTLSADTAKRFASIAASFPCLAGVPGMEPFDLVALVEDHAARGRATPHSQHIPLIDQWIAIGFVVLYAPPDVDLSELPEIVQQYAHNVGRAGESDAIAECASPSTRAAALALLDAPPWGPQTSIRVRATPAVEPDREREAAIDARLEALSLEFPLRD